MYNSFNLLNILQQQKFNTYYAHISKDDTYKETIGEHTNLVCTYFQKLISVHNLDNIINNLIMSLLKTYKYTHIKYAINLIKEIFMAIPIYHDIGKLNPNFQYYKMKNGQFRPKKFSFGTEHSKISAYLLIQAFLQKANDKKYKNNEKIINLFLLFAFSFTILKHHSPMINYENNFFFEEAFIDELFDFVNEYFIIFKKDEQKSIARMYNQKILKAWNDFDDSFLLFALLKLNYSLLTAADYLATTHFMNNWQTIYDDFGIMDKKLKIKIIQNVKNSTDYNKKIFKTLDSSYTTYKINFPQQPNLKNLNLLRQNLAIETIRNIRKNADKNLFYLEAPTGAGKTNLSMLIVGELLQQDIRLNQNSIQKIFYVFPFTTLITQTFQTLRKTLGLTNSEIVEIHSKTGFSQKNDDKYGKNRLNIIDYQFMNYPISLISHVKFFDILKSNRKTDNYLLHRMSNSIVIIDELQAYPPKEWDKVVYFIKNYSTYFNIKFILMSATLPKIDMLIPEKNKPFVNLVQDKNKYFNNPNFKDRVKFDFSILEDTNFDKKNKDEFLSKLWDKLINESKKYKKQNGKIHTIIEFIFKKTATQFVQLAKKQNNNFFDEIFILSGTILEPRRREIIYRLKSPEFKNKNILLITTQVVEAGVDIDMDIGFKDSSIPDSDEQLAGRINRNVSKKYCKLFIFDFDDAKTIYKKDYRFKIIKSNFKSEYFNILENKNFDLLYDKVIEYRKEHNEQLDYEDTLCSYLKDMKSLNFNNVNNKFNIIDNSIKTVTIFVPLKIPLKIFNSDEQNFTQSELEFLTEKNKYNKDKFIDGKQIWDLYCEVIENKETDFTERKIQRIILQGLLSKFSFSVGLYSGEFKKFIHSGNIEEKYGYYILHNVDEVYDYETGIKDINLDDIILW